MSVHGGYVRAALEIISGALAGYTEEQRAVRIAAGGWTQLSNKLEHVLQTPGASTGVGALAAQLRGLLASPEPGLTEPQQRLARAVQDIRQDWANNTGLDAETARSSIETCAQFLTELELEHAAEQVRELLHSLAAGDTGPVSASEPGAGPLSVRITHGTTVNYATAHTQARILERVVLENHGAASRQVLVTAVAMRGNLPVSAVARRHLELPCGTSTVHDLDVVLDLAAFALIDARSPGQLMVRVAENGKLIAEESGELELLPASHWPGASTQANAELLAVFVQPQHPALGQLLSDAGELFRTRTGGGDLEAAVGASERVDLSVACIFEVLGARGIRRGAQPTGWDLDQVGGQYLRGAHEVLTERVGSALETTLLLAGLLEAIGINSVIWLATDHAFLAYWRIPDGALPSASLDSQGAGALLNLIGAGQLRVVESTGITAVTPLPLAESSAGTLRDYAHGAEAAARLVYGVDVRAARRSGITPLPARGLSDAGRPVLIEYQAAAPDTLERFFKEKSSRARQIAPSSSRAVPPRITAWKNGLLDLSLRNRLLNFTERSRVSLAVPESVVDGFEDLINDGKAIELLPANEIGALDAQRHRSGPLLPIERRIELLLTRSRVYTRLETDTYVSRLRRLAGEAQRITDENGANNLYLALGSLTWSVEGRALRSPLFLIPVHLKPAGRGRHFRIEIDETGTSTPNFALAEKLHQEFGLRIPGFEDPALDASGIDVPAALAALREALVEADLPFHIEGTADLAILQFAKFRMWRDLDENWETFMAAPLVRHLVDSPTTIFNDPADTPSRAPEQDLDALAARCPVPADASQLEAVAAASAGRTFVLEGPPGTGKSQTITNLLAHAMAEGKRVLFVAEKRAALEVVRKRLDEVGLGEFALDLHDKGSSPNAVRAQIKASLDHLVFADQAGIKLASGDLDSATRTLGSYAHDLHEPNAAGVSAYAAHNTVLSMDPGIRALEVPASFATRATQEELALVHEALLRLPETAHPAAPGREHPWGFIAAPLSGHGIDAVLESASVLDAALADARCSNVDAAMTALIDAAKDPQQLRHLAELLEARVALEVLDAAAEPRWGESTQKLLAEATDLATTLTWLPEVVDPVVLEMDLAAMDAAAREADRFGFLGLGRKKRRAQVISEHFGGHWRGSESDAKNLVAVVSSLIEARARCSRLVEGLHASRGLEPGAHWNPFIDGDIALLARQRDRLLHLCALVPTQANPSYARTLREVLGRADGVDPGMAAELRSIATAWEGLAGAIPPASGTREIWSSTAGFLACYRNGAEQRGDAETGARGLKRWAAFIQALEPLKTHGLDEAWTSLATGDFEAIDALRGFMRGTAESSLAERLGAHGLDTFNAEFQQRMIERFTASSAALRTHLAKSLPEKIIARRAQVLKQSESRVGELARQLERRRGGMSVRQLMDSYGDLVATILPCVLVSPDSAARFFPPRAGEFDIVVFDEASQIRVADAIGTLGRAKSAVIVGDSKQMPPSSFAEVSIDNADESDSELLVTDEESILSEAVMARVGRRWLSWHYRSQDESLIAFSNRYYYDGKLSSFPSPRNGSTDRATPGYGITHRRVPGTFQRSGDAGVLRTNPVEAREILAEIKKRFAASPDSTPSIGVVTFNAPQRDLIETLLRDDPDERLEAALDAGSEGLFVKNLENVQGDERDVILFSTAFSANAQGKLPLNFGPLNNLGGERRLNVAITRARRQVLVFSSFDPTDLRAEDSSALGIKHLRAYLDAAVVGARAPGSGSTGALVRDRHREQVAHALRGRGHRVHTNVGLSDFRIDLTLAPADSPDTPLMAILLDNEAWAGRKTVGDRDGLPVAILRDVLGWPAVARVWLPAWLGDPAGVLDSLDAELLRAARGPGPVDEVGRNEIGEPVHCVMPAQHRRGTAREYVPWPVRQAGLLADLDDLGTPAGNKRAATLLAEILAVEAPIAPGRLAKLAINAYESSRVSSAREEAMLAALDPEAHTPDADGFICTATQRAQDWNDYRTGFAARGITIEEIAPREIANLMCALAPDGGPWSVEGLKREAMGVLGYSRMTQKASQCLQAGLESAVRSGRLESVAGKIRPVSRA
ncbi:MAG: DUF4011 domain-containing protein [Micrococcaceae bacterium]|nr:DUF4011 domain-containing protein [Micrococcaceae bacterium]